MSEPNASLLQNFERLKAEIQQMNRDITHGTKKPHKLVMLLAVLDMIDREVVQENRIYYNEGLLSSFENIFNLTRAKGDWNQAAPPFFHLRTSAFWNHKIIPGREEAYTKLKTSGGGVKRIRENIEYAYFSDYAYEVVSQQNARQELREFIISILNPYANFDGPAPVEPQRSKRG
ncbi:MAG: hypothetical protein PHC51_07660 [bacterium]|nr:hypothetical protein [bacterium]